jgi:antitoxin VapB
MAASLNVKDPEAHRLAQAIAQETGQSLTKVVVESLRERHAKIEKRNGKASLAELMAIAKRASRAVKRPYVEHGQLLYDERGLPK